MLKILVTYAVQGEFVELKWPDIEPYYVRTGIGKVKSAFHFLHITVYELATYKNISYLMIDCSGTSDIEHQVRLYLADCLCQMKG